MTLLCRRSTEQTSEFFFGKSDLCYAQLAFRHRNCKWIFGVLFGKEVYCQQLPTHFGKCVNILRSLEHRVQAGLPRQGRHFTCEIVGDVVMNRGLVPKLKLQIFFPGVLVGDTRKFMLAKISRYM